MPADAYRRLVRNQVERVPLDDAANRVVVTSVVPYPPGIPMMMPGRMRFRRWTLPLSKALRDWDGRSPALDTKPVGRGQGGGAILIV
jgi:lysine decarboxylase/arginine decarboxylase